jgi:hypothetical protein
VPEPTGSPSPQELAAQGARCAAHPELVAYAVCKRCGDFMCGNCSEGGRAPQCRNCRERTGGSSFPFSRDSYSFDGLLSYSFERFKAQWLNLCLSSLVLLVIVYGVSFAGGVAAAMLVGASSADSGRAAVGAVVVQGVMQLVQLVLQMWLQLGLFAITFDALEGRDVRVGTLFSRLGRLPALLVLMILIYFMVALFAVPVAGAYFAVEEAARLRTAGIAAAVMVFPMIYVMLGMSFAMLELVYNPKAGPLAALSTSFRLARGKRWATLGVAIFTMIVIMVGALACCVGFVPSMALGTLFYGAFFLALRTPTPAPS